MSLITVYKIEKQTSKKQLNPKWSKNEIKKIQR